MSEKAASFANQLCETLALPAANTLMGKGAVNEYKSYALGLAGMHGLPAANLAMKNCDLLIAVGARFSDRLLGKPGLFETGRVICHIDIDLCEHNKNVNADFCAHLPAEVFLQEAARLAACFGEKNKWQPGRGKRRNGKPNTLSPPPKQMKFCPKKWCAWRQSTLPKMAFWQPMWAKTKCLPPSTIPFLPPAVFNIRRAWHHGLWAFPPQSAGRWPPAALRFPFLWATAAFK